MRTKLAPPQGNYSICVPASSSPQTCDYLALPHCCATTPTHPLALSVVQIPPACMGTKA
jgi:hypothetical protein